MKPRYRIKYFTNSDILNIEIHCGPSTIKTFNKKSIEYTKMSKDNRYAIRYYRIALS